jgi:large subunit ribosomal protein L9
MLVILQQNVPKLGNIGDVVTVKAGYGRNYLVPRGLAVIANTRNVKALEHLKRQAARKSDQAKAEAEALAAQIAESGVTLKAEVGEEGKIHGSITNRQIADALAENGIEIDRRTITLSEAIKTTGAYEATISLGSEVSATLKVFVVEA